MPERIKLFFAFIFWKTIFGIAWVWCFLEDELWAPVWWYFNKHKYTRKK